MLDPEPFGFEVERDGDGGEKLRVLYSRPNDRFFQLQESLSETSTFIGDQILKGKQDFHSLRQDSLTFVIYTHCRDLGLHRNRARPHFHPPALSTSLQKPAEKQE